MRENWEDRREGRGMEDRGGRASSQTICLKDFFIFYLVNKLNWITFCTVYFFGNKSCVNKAAIQYSSVWTNPKQVQLLLLPFI